MLAACIEKSMHAAGAEPPAADFTRWPWPATSSPTRSITAGGVGGPGVRGGGGALLRLAAGVGAVAPPGPPAWAGRLSNLTVSTQVMTVGWDARRPRRRGRVPPPRRPARWRMVPLATQLPAPVRGLPPSPFERDAFQ